MDSFTRILSAMFSLASSLPKLRSGRIVDGRSCNGDSRIDLPMPKVLQKGFEVGPHSVNPMTNVFVLPTFGVFLIMFFWLNLFQEGMCGGVLVTKEQVFHADSSAKAFIFESIKDVGPHFVIETKAGTSLMDKSKFMRYIELPPGIAKNVFCDEHVDSIRNKIVEITSFCERFPSSKPLFQDRIDLLMRTVSSFESGFVCFESKWMRSQDFEKLRERHAEQWAKIEHAEKKRFEERKIAFEKARNLEQLDQSEFQRSKSSIELEVNESSEIAIDYNVVQAGEYGAYIEFRDGQGVLRDGFIEDYTASEESPATSKVNLYFGGRYRQSINNPGTLTKSFFLSKKLAILRLKIGGKSWAEANKYAWPSDEEIRVNGRFIWISGYLRKDGTWVNGHYRDTQDIRVAATLRAQPRLQNPSYGTNVVNGSSYVNRSNSKGSVPVRSYVRKDGTRVSSHSRTYPDGVSSNNLSSRKSSRR